jgi:hypothetical protein
MGWGWEIHKAAVVDGDQSTEGSKIALRTPQFFAFPNTRQAITALAKATVYLAPNWVAHFGR